LRWKLIRRRLSVSAPRMIVRSHLPWPLRWAVLALVLGFSGALVLWSFEIGKDLAGLDEDLRPQLERLQAELQSLRAERDRAQSLANSADSLLKAGQAAQARLAEQLSQAEARAQSLQADLAFYERLLPAGDKPLQLRALQADVPAAGQLRYQMLVMQPGPKPTPFSGRYDMVLIGELGGKPWRMSLPGGPRPLSVKQVARVEGLIDHPPAAVLKNVQARVLDRQGLVLASETLNLP
jgi:multidrug efflux pump subunit AcrA (membrane-fusion protein)